MQAVYVVQVVTAGLGVGGTLAAALLTQAANRRADRDRYSREDRHRWLVERQRVGTRFLAGALAVERNLWSLCSHLDREDRPERLPGHTTVLLTPEEGIPGVLDALTREILIEGIEEAFADLEGLEELVAEITLIGTPSEAAAASDLMGRLADTVGWLESFAPFDVAADSVEGCRTARDLFSVEARKSLQVDGGFTPPDRRPRA
ncbi:hypothetical protein [Streptomyces fungicidicus]|uniref:hypothetical protein n=1 Tax=Streptomyces fungicidicus TaxID=68203 RepID=UPI0013CE68C8|nr:hypothetical protein [Streptomyces fungicidicus]